MVGSFLRTPSFKPPGPQYRSFALAGYVKLSSASWQIYTQQPQKPSKQRKPFEGVVALGTLQKLVPRNRASLMFLLASSSSQRQLAFSEQSTGKQGK